MSTTTVTATTTTAAVVHIEKRFRWTHLPFSEGKGSITKIKKIKRSSSSSSNNNKQNDEVSISSHLGIDEPVLAELACLRQVGRQLGERGAELLRLGGEAGLLGAELLLPLSGGRQLRPVGGVDSPAVDIETGGAVGG